MRTLKEMAERIDDNFECPLRMPSCLHRACVYFDGTDPGRPACSWHKAKAQEKAEMTEETALLPISEDPR